MEESYLKSYEDSEHEESSDGTKSEYSESDNDEQDKEIYTAEDLRFIPNQKDLENVDWEKVLLYW